MYPKVNIGRWKYGWELDGGCAGKYLRAHSLRWRDDYELVVYRLGGEYKIEVFYFGKGGYSKGNGRTSATAYSKHLNTAKKIALALAQLMRTHEYEPVKPRRVADRAVK